VASTPEQCELEVGSGRKRNAEYLTSRSRKERVQALSVPGAEKFEGKL
jgi:hypothetical protein